MAEQNGTTLTCCSMEVHRMGPLEWDFLVEREQNWPSRDRARRSQYSNTALPRKRNNNCKTPAYWPRRKLRKPAKVMPQIQKAYEGTS